MSIPQKHHFKEWKNFSILWVAYTVLLLLTSCSQYKNTTFSKGFHNTTARYNAYFLAREKMKEVEANIQQAHLDDYNEILLVYPKVNETSEGTIKNDLEYIITKAALPVNKHKNSKWVDDSYNLIGKARLYQRNYKLATQTFKYVNTKSEDNDARHHAMILLLRTYLDSLQLENARATNEYLRKEDIYEANAADLFMTRASFHQTIEELELMRLNLEKAIPYLKKGDKRARVYFILGQLYQHENNDSAAYANYKKVFKNNPPYELFFYARLYIAQVSSLANNDQRKIEKYFRKLLKDQKNQEYKDKIYYEMGKYELKQKDYTSAIKHFETSIQENKGNQFQKARSYLALGNLYYDNLQKFELSKLYFDSTVSLWDSKDKEYEWIANRQKILEEFVLHYQTVQTEDSLQRLSNMDSVTLVKHINKIIEKEAQQEREKAIQEALAEKKRKDLEAFEQQQNNLTQNTIPAPAGNKIWYFYDPKVIAKGKTDFRKIWGKRPLEDNWRRSEKEVFTEFEVAPEVEVQEETIVDNTQDSLQAIQAKREAMYNAVPRTKAELDTSHAHLENALYNLGKIYNLKLLEPANAIYSFEDLLKRYPQSDLKPEIYYFLYLILKAQKSDQYMVYRNKLISEFPNSTYAKIIHNPNYLAENKVNNQKAGELYKVAFDSHKQKAFITSDSILANINIQYPDNDIKDKIEFLSILNKGKTENPLRYISLLENFILQYPSSSIVPFAQEQIERTNRHIGEQIEKGHNLENQTRFMLDFERPHYFSILFNPQLINAEKLKNDIVTFNKSKKFTYPVPETKNFTDTTAILYISGFTNKDAAKKYMEEITENGKVLNKYENRISILVISSDNFVILERSGNTIGYLDFYKRNYNDRLMYGK